MYRKVDDTTPAPKPLLPVILDKIQNRPASVRQTRSIRIGIRTLTIPSFSRQAVKVAVAKGAIGTVLLWQGISIAGSYFYAATKFKEFMADLAYTYQGGTILLVLGLLVLYEMLNGLRSEYYKYK